MEFAKKKIVTTQINEVIQYFADQYTHGNRDKALNLLDEHQSPLRKKDAVLLTYFAGLLTMIAFILIVLIIIPQDGDHTHKYNETDAILANLYTFRFLLMVVFLILASTFCVKIFRDYKINYMFIMELDPHYKLTHI